MLIDELAPLSLSFASPSSHVGATEKPMLRDMNARTAWAHAVHMYELGWRRSLHILLPSAGRLALVKA